MKEMTSEWLARGKDIQGVQQVIEAEYHIVTETPPKGGEESGKKPAEKVAAAPKPKKLESSAAAEEEGDFNIDPTWLKESLTELKWSDDTAKTFLVSQYKVSPQGTLEDVIKRLTRDQAGEFVKEIQDRVAQKQMELFT